MMPMPVAGVQPFLCAGVDLGLWAYSRPKRLASAAAAIGHALHHGSPRAQRQAQPQERDLPQRPRCSFAHPLPQVVKRLCATVERVDPVVGYEERARPYDRTARVHSVCVYATDRRNLAIG